MGNAVVDQIIEERAKNGKFQSFTDFCERMDNYSVNKKCVESLIKAGVFDEFGKTRATLLASFENILDTISNANKNIMENQVSMFDLVSSGAEEKEAQKYVFTELEEMDDKEFLSMEKEMLGIYLSGHPLEKYRKTIEQITNISSLKMLEIDEQMQETGNTAEYQDGQNVKIMGIVSKVKKKITRNNSLMAFVTLDDLFGSFETIVFESIYNKCGYLLEEEKIVLIEGRLSIREDEPTKIIVNNVKEILNDGIKEKTYININITTFSEEKKEKLRQMIKQYSKESNLNAQVDVTINGEIRNCGKIMLNEQIAQQFEDIAGRENVMYK